jgi:hypothetical protein
MPYCRLATAVVALALLASRAPAQVTDPLEPTTKPPLAADAVAAPAHEETAATPPTVKVSPVPEPGSILLLAGPAAVGWVAYWRRKWRAEPNANGPTTQP